MRKNDRKKPSTLFAVAKCLDAGGFTSHTAHIIERYWRHAWKNKERNEERFSRLDEEASNIFKKLTVSEKMIVGKFISWKDRMAFEAGLRIGLAARLINEDEKK